MSSNRSSTGYSQYILNTGHNYGNTENVMTVIKADKYGQYLDSLEKYRICKITKQNLQIIHM
jgi:hypothetical protein